MLEHRGAGLYKATSHSQGFPLRSGVGIEVRECARDLTWGLLLRSGSAHYDLGLTHHRQQPRRLQYTIITTVVVTLNFIMSIIIVINIIIGNNVFACSSTSRVCVPLDCDCASLPFIIMIMIIVMVVIIIIFFLSYALQSKIAWTQWSIWSPEGPVPQQANLAAEQGARAASLGPQHQMQHRKLPQTGATGHSDPCHK